MRNLFSKHETSAAEAARDPGPHILDEGAIHARWFIEYRLAQEVDRARRYGRPLAVLAGVPDTLPGETLPRDAVMAAAVAALATARNTDLVGWMGEDRILIVLPETTTEDAKVAMARWRDEMYLRSRSVGGQKWLLHLLDEVDEFDSPVRLETALYDRNRQEGKAA